MPPGTTRISSVAAVPKNGLFEDETLQDLKLTYHSLQVFL